MKEADFNNQVKKIEFSYNKFLHTLTKASLFDSNEYLRNNDMLRSILEVYERDLNDNSIFPLKNDLKLSNIKAHQNMAYALEQYKKSLKEEEEIQKELESLPIENA
mmetsp:Transcript_6787/g.9892  ORF Transcript_6787/g.9892 Transcript_6787/m.9892 type:complete len:106 (+) Transcript_6787:44-361(+)